MKRINLVLLAALIFVCNINAAKALTAEVTGTFYFKPSKDFPATFIDIFKGRDSALPTAEKAIPVTGSYSGKKTLTLDEVYTGDQSKYQFVVPVSNSILDIVNPKRPVKKLQKVGLVDLFFGGSSNNQGSVGDDLNSVNQVLKKKQKKAKGVNLKALRKSKLKKAKVKTLSLGGQTMSIIKLTTIKKRNVGTVVGFAQKVEDGKKALGRFTLEFKF